MGTLKEREKFQPFQSVAKSAAGEANLSRRFDHRYTVEHSDADGPRNPCVATRPLDAPGKRLLRLIVSGQLHRSRLHICCMFFVLFFSIL